MAAANLQADIDAINARLAQMGLQNVLTGNAPGIVKHPGQFLGRPAEDINAWIDDFETYCNTYTIPEDQRLQILPGALEGHAKAIYLAFDQYAKTHYRADVAAAGGAAAQNSLLTCLKNSFDTADNRQFFVQKLRALVQKPNQGVYAYSQEVSKCVKGAFVHTRGNANADAFSDFAKEHFIRGLLPKYKEKVQTQGT